MKKSNKALAFVCEDYFPTNPAQTSHDNVEALLDKMLPSQDRQLILHDYIQIIPFRSPSLSLKRTNVFLALK